IGGIGAVLHRTREERVDGLVVARDEPRKRRLRTCAQLGYESGFFGLNRQRAGDIAHGEVRLQTSVLPPYRKSGTLGIRRILPLASGPTATRPDGVTPPLANSS